MGCCHGREGKITGRGVPPPFMKEDEVTISQKAREIARLMDAIMKKQGWTLHIDEPCCSILTMEGSPFDSIHPVLYVKLTFSQGTPHEGLLRVLTSPPIRLGWDSTFVSMEVNKAYSAWHYVTRTVVDTQIPFMKPREFLEEKLVTSDDRGLTMLFHSVDLPEIPANEDVERAETIFGFYKIEGSAPTVLHFVSQHDLKSSFVRIAFNMGVVRIHNWTKKLVERVLALNQ
mmetsp:Transcript_28842/g.51369  ORF Transcript_28842/g.51369 Transcript_28842/m.51369 type:complete len:230 (-) Transcript_28842:621-1310(-)